jgi:transposase
LGVALTAANVPDVHAIEPVLDAIPAVGGKPGPRRSRPDVVYADRGYDSAKVRDALRARGIEPKIARRLTAHGSGLGRFRWVVERTVSWLHQFRRLRVRFERRADIHEAFLWLACGLICLRELQK